MNKTILSGRIVKDAELSFLAGSGVAKMQYTLAVERSYQKDKNNKKVDFINCEAIGKHCENLVQYVTKGKLVLVEGELNIDQYQDQEGKMKYATKVKVDRLEFLGSGNGEKKEDAPYEPNLTPIDDDDVPF